MLFSHDQPSYEIVGRSWKTWTMLDVAHKEWGGLQSVLQMHHCNKLECFLKYVTLVMWIECNGRTVLCWRAIPSDSNLIPLHLSLTKRPFHLQNMSDVNNEPACPSETVSTSNKQSSVLVCLCLIALLIYLISSLRDECIHYCLSRIICLLFFHPP